MATCDIDDDSSHAYLYQKMAFVVVVQAAITVNFMQ